MIDTEDFELVNSFPNSWIIHWSNKNHFYVMGNRSRKFGKNRYVSLHRWIMGMPEGMHIDHINHDTLNNRRSINLREVTRSENQQNRVTFNAQNTSGFRGVSFDKSKGMYSAQLNYAGKNVHLGHFANKFEAARVVENGRKEYGFKTNKK